MTSPLGSADSPSAFTVHSNAPLTIINVGGTKSPSTPAGIFDTPDITRVNTTTSPVTVSHQAANIPAGTTVTVRVTPLRGRKSRR